MIPYKITRSPLLLVALGVLGTARAVADAGAQQPDTTTRGDSAGAAPRHLGALVVSGTRLSTADGERTPGQVDVIDPHTAPPGPAAAAALLTRLPGVSLSNDQGTRAQPTLDVRGFTLSPVIGVPQGVSVFLDGVRVNEPDAQEIDFDLLPMDAVAHAELIRGPAVLFGKNTLAGALNLVTARGGPVPVLEGGIDAGSFGYRAARLVASGARHGIDGYLAARATDETGYRAADSAATRSLFATVGHRGRAGDVALSVLYAHDRIHEAGSLPESWFAVDPRVNYTGGDFFRPELLQVTARGSRPLGDGTLRANLFARRNAIEQYNVNVADPNNRAFITNGSAGGTAELDLPLRLGTLPLTLTAGAEATRSRVRYHLLAEPTAAAPTLPPECDPTSGLCDEARVNGTDAAVFAQGVLQATDRLTLLLAARADYVRVPFRDLQHPANSGTSTFRRVSPEIGARLRLSDRLRGYATVASGFRAPAALELACASPSAPCPLPFSLGADPPLRPVTEWNYETGLDWDPLPGTTVEASAFRTAVRNEIAFVTSGTAAGYFQNVPRTRRDGIETALRARLPAGARIFGSYSYLAATYRSTVALASVLPGNVAQPGDQLALTPRQRVTAGVGAAHAWPRVVLDGSLSLRAVSSQVLRGDEAARTPPLPGYAVADLDGAATWAHVTVRASVTNLLDRRYAVYGVWGVNPKGAIGGPVPATAPVERFLTPAEPRAVTLGVSIRR